MAKEPEKKKKKVKHPPIDGVTTYVEGTKVTTREYRVKSGLKF